MFSDAEYTASSDRVDGVKDGIAIPRLHNKLFRQISFMAVAAARFIESKGFDATDTDLNTLIGNFAAAFGSQSTPFTTGDLKLNPYLLAPETGWIYASGTIGNAISGASNRANADTQALFIAAWNATTDNPENAQVFNELGEVVTRGASGLADFSAGRQIAIVDARGRFPLGRDNMSGVSAGSVTEASLDGARASQFGGKGGAETDRLTIATMPEHDHDTTTLLYTSGPVDNGSGNGRYPTKTGKTGGGQPHNNMPPYFVTDIFIKL
jgi:microcystin-dependent protein